MVVSLVVCPVRIIHKYLDCVNPVNNVVDLLLDREVNIHEKCVKCSNNVICVRENV